MQVLLTDCGMPPFLGFTIVCVFVAEDVVAVATAAGETVDAVPPAEVTAAATGLLSCTVAASPLIAEKNMVLIPMSTIDTVIFVMPGLLVQLSRTICLHPRVSIYLSSYAFETPIFSVYDYKNGLWSTPQYSLLLPLFKLHPSKLGELSAASPSRHRTSHLVNEYFVPNILENNRQLMHHHGLQ